LTPLACPLAGVESKGARPTGAKFLNHHPQSVQAGSQPPPGRAHMS
jgi:hypothetical protein